MSNLDYFMNNIARKACGLAIADAASPDAKVTVDPVFTIQGWLYFATADSIDLTNYTYTVPSTGLDATAALTIEDQFQAILTVTLNANGDYSIYKSPEFAFGGVFNTQEIVEPTLDKAVIGYIFIANDTGAQFVGGTTALDASDLTVHYLDASASNGA